MSIVSRPAENGHRLERPSLRVMGKVTCPKQEQCVLSPESPVELIRKRRIELVGLLSSGAALMSLS